MSNDKPKWTEIEHLPEWDEEFYEVYTAKKHGKWVMLKTLRKEFADKPEYRDMIEKEFDVRYNLANPNIIMINDFEEVPGLGMCIITDDVYGDSLRKIIDSGKVDSDIINKITTRLVDAIDYIQTNHIVHHPVRPETIIFTENIRNLKVIDVGFDQRSHLSPTDASEDIHSFGKVLKESLNAAGDSNPRLHAVADRCLAPNPRDRYRNIPDLRLALAGDSNRKLYLIIIVFLSIMTVILALLCIFHPNF